MPEGTGAVAKKLWWCPPIEPAPDEGRALKTLLRRCVLCSRLSADAGVVRPALGAKLFRPPPVLFAPNILFVELRCTDWKPRSARLFPEDER